MCGIFGIASASPTEFAIDEALNTIAHRGPDDSTTYIDTHVGLGHRRLSIIDLAGGKQPIFNEDGTKCIIFNGEIYNYLRLRDQLIAKGHRFATRSDTETILHAYEQWGEECVTRLRGMFAFAIWDSRERTLFLARDRLGIKPLFYAEHNGRFYFASEIKAILCDPEFPRRINERALASYFSLSYIPDTPTIFRKINKLLPGHWLKWKNGAVETRKYWDLYFQPDYSKKENTFVNEFIELFDQSVEMRLMSEVPLGTFLSGGIDSSLVAASMSQSSASAVNTFCIGFGGDVGGYLDERHFAQMVADRYATHHRSYQVAPQTDGLVEKIVRAFDEPFADDSTIPSYFVCEIARRKVTVALSGLGGDEAFAGYERYLGFTLHRHYRRLPASLRSSFLPGLVNLIPERSDGHYTVNHLKRFVRSGAQDSADAYFGYLSIMHPKMRATFFADNRKFLPFFDDCRDTLLKYYHSPNVDGGPDSLNRALYCDIKTYLPDDILAVTDRMSMHHSLEVRVPFIDHRLLEYCATIPPEMKIRWFQKKYLLKKAAQRFLPAPVIDHRKQGFVGPLTQWLRNDLKHYVQTSLDRRHLDRHGLLNPSVVKTILDEHFSGKEIHDTLIWSILMFQKWFDLYIDHPER